MRQYEVGDRSKAICSFCVSIQPITFFERDVTLSSGRAVVQHILVGVCDVCDHVITVPHQSVDAIRDTIDRLPKT